MSSGFTDQQFGELYELYIVLLGRLKLKWSFSWGGYKVPNMSMGQTYRPAQKFVGYLISARWIEQDVAPKHVLQLMFKGGSHITLDDDDLASLKVGVYP